MKVKKTTSEVAVSNKRKKMVKITLVDNANSIMACGGSWLCNESK